MSKAWLEARLLPAAFLFRFHALDFGVQGGRVRLRLFSGRRLTRPFRFLRPHTLLP